MKSASAALALHEPEASAPTNPPRMDRRIPIVIAVVGLHVLGLWALQAGLLRRAVELVIPVSVLAEMIEPAQPLVTPAPPPQPRPAPTPRAAPQPKPAAQPAPQPMAVATPTRVSEAPTGVIESQRAAPVAAVAPPAAESAAPPAPPAPPRIELPSSSADYLNNPPPPYPPLSKRLGEQGQVVIRAFIDANGTATQAEVRTSSGYDRLDQAALQTVLKWRYVPGKRAGMPEGMWFNVPIHFVLE